MPLFGKKEKSNTEKPPCPGQNMAPYPTQNYGSNCYAQGQAPSDAPPPYSAVAPPYAAQGQPSLQPLPGPPTQVPGGTPVYGYPSPQTVVVQGGFDAGARFDANIRPSIPPPPPGCMLHPAQMAAMHGNNVVVTQKKSDFWNGGSDGGYALF